MIYLELLKHTKLSRDSYGFSNVVRDFSTTVTCADLSQGHGRFSLYLDWSHASKYQMLTHFDTKPIALDDLMFISTFAMALLSVFNGAISEVDDVCVSEGDGESQVLHAWYGHQHVPY